MAGPTRFDLKIDRPVITESGESIMFKGMIDIDKALEFFIAKIKIDREIIGAPDGIYTWMLKDRAFIITPVESEQEIGSLHENLLYWTPPSFGRLVAAGELEKQGNTLLYNLKSETYMKPALLQRWDSLRFRSLVSSKINELRPLQVKFLECNSNCKPGYDTFSGESIISQRKIVTPTPLVLSYRQFFREAAEPNLGNFYSRHSKNIKNLNEYAKGGYRRKPRVTRRKSKKTLNKAKSRTPKSR